MKQEYFSEDRADQLLRNGFGRAEETLRSQDRIEVLLQRAEETLRNANMGGLQPIADAAAYVPVFISLVRAYIKGTYRDVPTGSIIAVVSALIYYVSPVDLIPDFIPVAGTLDDAAVILACMRFIRKDLDAYIAWRDGGK